VSSFIREEENARGEPGPRGDSSGLGDQGFLAGASWGQEGVVKKGKQPSRSVPTFSGARKGQEVMAISQQPNKKGAVRRGTNPENTSDWGEENSCTP